MPAFNALISSYTVNVDNSVTSITISATPEDANATVTGTGIHSLNVGSNTLPVIVTAMVWASKTYTITVIRAEPLPDRYEPNNTLAQAYSLPVSLLNNVVSAKTTGSNFHNATDVDYYKIVLPPGIDYTITARLHDSNSSSDGNTYTVDAKFKYSIDGLRWSDAYDDIMPGSIIMEGGGTVYFLVTPYFEGRTGTYLLDISSKQTGNSIADLKNSSILAYPNPAHNQITISGLHGNGMLTVFDVVGRIRLQHNIVSSQETLSVDSLPSGNYPVQIVEGENVKYIKIIVKHTISN